MSSSACVVYLLLLATCLTCSGLYRRAGTFAAVCYWLVAVTSFMTSPGHVTPMAYYVVVTSYTMLPLTKTGVCVLLGLTTSIVHLVVFTAISALQSTNHLVFQVNYRRRFILA